MKPQCTYAHAILRQRHRRTQEEEASEASRYIYSLPTTWTPSTTTGQWIFESRFFWDLQVRFFWDLLVFLRPSTVFFETFSFFLRPSHCFLWDLHFVFFETLRFFWGYVERETLRARWFPIPVALYTVSILGRERRRLEASLASSSCDLLWRLRTRAWV